MVLSALYLSISRQGNKVWDEKLFSVLLKLIQFFCHGVLKLSCLKLCRNKVEWITKIIQRACTLLLLLFMHFRLTDPPFKSFD